MVLLHSTKMQKHAPTQEGGAGSHAAVMSLEQNGDEVKYKVKLGRAGAVMMAARSDESDDEELGMTPSRGENEMRTVVEMLSQVRQGLRFRVQVRQGLGFRCGRAATITDAPAGCSSCESRLEASPR